jgi:hypothetical protein
VSEKARCAPITSLLSRLTSARPVRVKNAIGISGRGRRRPAAGQDLPSPIRADSQACHQADARLRHGDDRDEQGELADHGIGLPVDQGVHHPAGQHGRGDGQDRPDKR